MTTQQLPILTPAQERKFQIHYAKIMLTEARARRRSQGGFHAILLNGAARARKAAAAVDLRPEQPDMFAGTMAISSQHQSSPKG